MNTPASEPVALRLIDREFLIACSPEERDGLLEAAGFLDRKMRELRANAKAPSFERLTVLTAISVAHEFLILRKQHESQEQRLSDGLATLQRKLADAFEHEAPKR
ncbi:cell division protein ZapA [Rhodanobacter ginsengiterrae]|uniref:cell division protein ZapA n=1 Tax=Rhodanobacter ginsengiterrae TaxID=2008451 RepID=UPI003CF13B6C